MIKVFIPIFPGTNCEDDSLKVYQRLGADVQTELFINLTNEDIQKSISKFAKYIKDTDILFLPGGFSAGDEPNGSAKFITNVLRNPEIESAINTLLEKGGLILGICNGFQALVKTGLLPYGKIMPPSKIEYTLTDNDNGSHISRVVNTKVINTNSPFLNKCDKNIEYFIPISHGEGKFMCSEINLQTLIDNNQIATIYVDNPNGSIHNIEGIISKNGQIFGKMAHSERSNNNQYINIPQNQIQPIFESSLEYIKSRKESDR